MAAPPSNDPLAAEFLRRAHSPDAADDIFTERVRQRALPLRPTSPDRQRDARSKRQYDRLKKERARQRSKKPKPLSSKQKRALCVYEIPKAQQKFHLYEPLHRLWCEYMREILDVGNGKKAYVSAQVSGPILASADYHGALVEVVRSRCVSRVGIKGIVVKDTKYTFEVVTRKDEVKTVPKEHTVFRFELPWEEDEDDDKEKNKQPLSFEIYGSRFESRAPDRASKKFRWHHDPDL